METLRLYERQPDMMRFRATVLACRNSPCALILDRTAFFPEGGGQGADHGLLDGVPVLDVQEREGEILHFTQRPIPEGTRVEGLLDEGRRRDMMQQHTGEHMFSGLVCRLFDCSNVGFHIGSDLVTMDFSRKLTRDQILQVQDMVNEAIFRDLPVEILYPTDTELAKMEYRSKKEIRGQVRIVRIPGLDTCACCGTHVTSTGRVGQLKVLGLQNYKGGVRVSVLCGMRALEAENAMVLENQALRHLLSAPEGSLVPALQQLLQERDRLRQDRDSLAMECFRSLARSETDRRVRVLSAPFLTPAQLRPAAALLKGAGPALVLVPREQGFSFALCMDRPEDTARALYERFGGRGGGRQDMIQGTLETGSPEEIRRFLEAL